MDVPARREPMGFRLVRQPDGRTGAAAEGLGRRRFTATILLEKREEPDVEAVAATLATRFPTIGRIGVRPSAGDGVPGAVTIDGARIWLQLSERVPEEDFLPPLRLFRAWDPTPAIQAHVAAMDVTCGGDLPGLDGAEAYAAAVHFVATAACRVAPACAVFWREGWAIGEPDDFAEEAESILSGRMPLASWVSFAAIVPTGRSPEDATGMVTYGLRPFIGREMELAPHPGGLRAAYRCISRIASMALDRGIPLEDGQRLTDPEGELGLTVRKRDYWLRPDQSAFVLVADDSLIDADTLKTRIA